MLEQEAAVALETCEGVDLTVLARREGTPLYVYSTDAIRSRLKALQAALQDMDAGICYAVKANSNGAVLRMLGEMGAGADIVSGGELQRALRAGIPADRIVFSGVGKSADEIEQGLDAGVARFNLESLAELDLLQALASKRGVIARASVRINPDVDAMTHAKISTGKS
ncbi:MAG: diaminopimelate decarboxylase, partial [Thermomonas sp.]